MIKYILYIYIYIYGQVYGLRGQWVLNQMNRFIGSSPVVTTNNYYTIANIHNLQSLHTNLLSLFPLIFTVRFLATEL
jgi:hypothetical protein